MKSNSACGPQVLSWLLGSLVLACATEPAIQSPLPVAVAGTTGSAGSATSDPASDASAPTAPRAPLRRLTRFEYNNTVRDLGLDSSGPAEVLPGEELGNGFGNDADALTASALLVDGYRRLAQDLGEKIANEPAALSLLAGCDPAVVGEAACAAQLIDSFGARAYRRPLVDAETAMLQAVFDSGRMLGGSFAAGVSDVLEAVLQAPQFLYRVELGQPSDVPGLARPSDYEMASRLSYLFWGSTPDATLLQAAAASELRTASQVLAQAQRLLAEPRARDVVRFFHSQWLGIRGLDNLVRSAQYYPTFEPGMGGLFRQESERFVEDVVFSGAGTLGALFSADYSYMNEALAAFYGVAGVSGSEFRKVPVDVTRRSGLLTHASILAATTPGSRTDPVVRGKWLFSKVLCGTVPDPPPGVPQLAEPTPGISVRERLGQHRANEPCKSCHTLMDPLGFTFEHYDGVGLWRDSDNGAPVDATAELMTHDIAGPVSGLLELSTKLAASADAQRCYVGRWLTFAYGRAETASDASTRSALESAFASTGGNVQQLLLALSQTDAFMYRPTSMSGANP